MKEVEKESEKYFKRKKSVLSDYKSKCEEYQDFIEEYNFSVEDEYIPEQLSFDVDLQKVSKESPEPIKMYAANQYLEDIREVGRRILNVFKELKEDDAVYDMEEYLETIQTQLE